MPPKKPKNSAVSDRRHGTGLIAPGKQISRQRSIPHISAHANGKVSSSVPASSAHLSPAANPPLSQDHNDEDSDIEDMPFSTRSDDERGEHMGITQRHQNGTVGTHGHQTERMLGDLTNGDYSTVDSTSTMPQDVVTTIIGQHCRWDMLAMLLLLLQLPILPQLLVQVAFVCLIVGNDTNSWLSKRLSLGENWLKIHGGNPSFGTSLLSDALAGGIWLMFGKPYQDLALDMALAVIAICLGGGAATRDSWRESAMCTLTIVSTHFLQGPQRRQRVLHRLWSLLSRLSLGQSLVPLAILSSGPNSTATVQHAPDKFPDMPNLSQPVSAWALNIVKALLGIHIGTYGLIRTVRRWYENNRERSLSIKSDPRLDMELPSFAGSSASLITQDGTVDGVRNGSTDGRPPGPYPTATGHNKITSNGRKRRKQATFVRIQQPFWAAIAQVKMTFDRELELSQADHIGFESSGKTQHHTGGGLRKLEGRAFITNVEDIEIGFSAVVAAPEEAQETDEERSPERERRGSLGSRYLDVRINKAYWTSVDCKDIPPTKEHPDRCFVDGKIYGLTPLASYFVEILSSTSQTAIYSANISTRALTTSDHAPTLSAQSQDKLRPLSPVTTLKTSIASIDGKLSDHKAKSNKTRKAHQNTTRGLKQEVSELTKSVQSCGSDDKQRQRQLQYRQNIKQADEAAQDLAAQLANLGDMPKADKQAYDTSKKKYKATVDRTQTLKKALDAAKRESQKAVQEAENDNAKIRGKREKTETRLASLVDRRKTTVDENNAKRNAKVQTETQHRQKMDYYRNQERMDSSRLQALATERDSVQARIGALQQQYFAESSYAQAYSGQQSGSQHTPESAYAGMAPTTTRPPPGFGYMYAASFSGNGMQHARQSSLRQRHNRSSSMLSNMSGFTDDATGGANTTLEGYNIPRNGSSNSGGTGSQRDPSSPHPKLSPIGTEVGRGSPRQMGGMKR